MDDRNVRTLGGQIAPFSSFQEQACVVLLGDPGAGKSHLFQTTARRLGGQYLSVRQFLALNPAKIVSGSLLFIDALDEYRCHYGDMPAIDKLVERIGLLEQCRIRLSCRSADWLGKSDINVLSTCYGEEEITVLRLQPLGEDEQLEVARQCNVDDPVVFLQQASSHGFDEGLGNPLTLRLLAEVANNAQWPKTRTALFEHACAILLNEHNEEHLLGKLSELSDEQLLLAAGGLCALQLLADIDGVSAQEIREPRLPLIKNLPLCSELSIRAALRSRVFLADHDSGAFHQSHKVIAEFLAARYLAKLFFNGVPLTRLRQLLGPEGQPVSHLRGVHAWLCNFLPAHVQLFIDQDPYGVLSYGDAASFSSQSKQQLFAALAQLAVIDPGFRGYDRSTQALVGVAEPSLAPCFEVLMADSSTPYTLRLLVLDTLRVGCPMPDLCNALYELMISSDRRLDERFYALEALLKIGASGVAAMREAMQVLSRERRGTRLRAQILRRAPMIGWKAEDILELYGHSLTEETQQPSSLRSWQLHELISGEDIPAVLDGGVMLLAKPANKEATHELVDFMMSLIIRYVETAPDLCELRLFAWLNHVNAMSVWFSPAQCEALRNALVSREGSDLAWEGIRDRAASFEGLENFPFAVPAVKTVTESVVDEEPLSFRVEMLDELVAQMELCFEQGMMPEELDPALLEMLIFRLMERRRLGERPWFKAFRERQYDVYIECMAFRLFCDFAEGLNSGAKVLELATDIPHSDKLDVVTRLMPSVISLGGNLFYHMVRPYYRELDSPSMWRSMWALFCEGGLGQNKTLLIALGLLMSFERFMPALKDLNEQERNEVVWFLRDLSGLARGFAGPMNLTTQQFFDFCRLVAQQYPAQVESAIFSPINTRAEDAGYFMASLIGHVALKNCPDAKTGLLELQLDSSFAPWQDNIKHALAIHAARQRDSHHIRRGWKEIVCLLEGGVAEDIASLQLLVMEELIDVADSLRGNLDLHKLFWNEIDGKIDSPKWEESCRDVLLSFLRPRLEPRGFSAEPEAHMHDDKRVDIAVQKGSTKLVVELKRNLHADVWKAIENQLKALYTCDPGAQGYGIYGVFWFGMQGVKAGPDGRVPGNAKEMLEQLESTLETSDRARIKIFVLDVSGAK
ncbi:NACHT domain-containing protein [Pseudomonas sp. CCOS 191]|uniref:NACHT domain-containing protein n=1 Tax=Pseudomonas sp. CCOS 191 TaxID=1649877 RepID=UPI0006243B69|nr:hypothetical protein [Pseudomonas sp. CCOS 191]CRI59130.1 hypothetical protein CCOS191_4594 [Pseudomonas sp. CCOS 191]